MERKPSEHGATSYERLNFADRVAIGNIIADDVEDKIQAMWDYAYKRMQPADGEGTSEKPEPASTEPDTREKLEDDANTLALDYWDRKRTWGDANDLKREVIALLDRQAAITEREYGQRLAHEIADEWMDAKDEEVRELQAVVVELAEERDNLKAELIAERDEREGRCCVHYNADEHYCNIHETRIKALIADRDEWKAKAESFRKLEEENAKLRERAERAERLRVEGEG